MTAHVSAIVCCAMIGAIGLHCTAAAAAEWSLFARSLTVHTAEWTSNDHAGRRNYRGVNSRGDQFLLSCDPRSRRDGWEIDVRIDNQPAPPDEPIGIRVGASSISMRPDRNGKIHLNHAIHADPYYWLWTMIQQGHYLSIILSDARIATFNLQGARDALSDGVCKPNRRP